MTKLLFTLILMLMTASLPARAENEVARLNPLYTDPQVTARAPASEPTPEPDFVVTPPERGPASTAAKAIVSPSRRSKLPLDVINGFELRVQYQNLNSMFWVIERQGRYDLIYANSGGSRSSVSLAQPGFSQLHKVAASFKTFEENIAKCKNASMQLHVIAEKRKERTVTLCANSKSTAAKQLLQFSDQLAMMVR